MELTHEQLQLVENYLDKKDITYIDIRTEVFDHIVSDIETKIEIEKSDFKTTFHKVANKWNIHLKKESSWIFGVAYSLPKIALEKAKRSFKRYYFISVLSFIIPLFILTIIDLHFTENIKNELNLFLQTITVLTFIVFGLLFILKFKEKTKTTYSFILKTQSWNFIFSFIILFDLDFFNKNGNLMDSQLAFLIAFIFSTFSYFHFYKKHKEAIKKYKIS
ncbi:hypothetical protein MPF19_02085 [Polaribacter sp. Z014]|uniref:hypothetical protein n=1 Tax=Polaribacter sp. Z014 TaxID=2927126 RepID=UPI002021F34A|nr:hypothetical protein [Polaribacter sp. Z014]MCL7762188.1 hypothetical protein [Polaribacter sp. Z014]